MFNFHKKKKNTEPQSKQAYVIWYLNNQLHPLNKELRDTTKRIYTRLEAARVFPSEDNTYLNKLNLAITSLRTHLSYLLEEYDKERHEVVKMIDEYDLEMSYPPEGYEIVVHEVRRILAGD